MYWEELEQEYAVYKTMPDGTRRQLMIKPSREYLIEKLQCRKSVQLFIDKLSVIEDMTDEEAGAYIKAIYNFATNLEEPQVSTRDRFLNQAYKNAISERIILDRKYVKECLQNLLNKVSIEEFERIVTNGYGSLRMVTDKDKEKDKDKDKDKEKDKEKDKDSASSDIDRQYFNECCKKEGIFSEGTIETLYIEACLNRPTDLKKFIKAQKLDFC